MDILSSILHSLHLSGSLWCRTEARAPWSMQFDKMDVAQFHFIRRGSSWFQMEGMGEPLLMASGDLIVLPHGHAHILSDQLNTKPVSLNEWKEKLKPCEKGPLIIGGQGTSTTLLCGYFEFDRGEVHPLLSVLPSFIYIKGEEGGSVPWLETTLNFIYSEADSGQPGSQTVITRLADILFIQIIRQYIDNPVNNRRGWLAGLKDPQIGSALEYIHLNPEKPWNLNSLSGTVGMSHASFSAKFKQVIGESPFKYLTRWRMHTAANYLKNPNSSLSEATEQVGYESEAAFSKTFKRYLGMGPGKYRRTFHQAG
ncbi:MAG: AraC family transcriptional regulator [Deltaproteobacteria bacterium]|nr:AraC family transcriptional regulator [Deltaproteobacteria bacterium]